MAFFLVMWITAQNRPVKESIAHRATNQEKAVSGQGEAGSQLEGGTARLHQPTKPGWGVELNEEALKKYPAKPWHRGFQYREDGSVAYI